MKLNPIFKVENNKLFFIETDADAHFESPLESSLKDFLSNSFNAFFQGKFLLLEIEQSEIEIGVEVYAEDVLAALREKLLLCDESNRFVVLASMTKNPLVHDNGALAFSNLEAFVNTFNHTARRVKDCKSVVGFDLSYLVEQTNGKLETINQFIETLSKKHAQYVYFLREDVVQAVRLDLAKVNVVVY